jgi:hypothetical protein
MCLIANLLPFLSAKGETLSDRGLQAFPRRSSVLKDSFKGNFEREVVKTDYFIFQKTGRQARYAALQLLFFDGTLGAVCFIGKWRRA